MDLKLIKKDIVTNDIEIITGEQPFDSEILLPDYYQDIMKILKCVAKPVVLKTNKIGEKVIIEGVVSIRIFYQTTEMELRAVSTRIEYSKTIDINRASSDDIYISPNASLEYVNCRAINERKIDIKGALSLRIKMFYNLKTQILTEAKGRGLQTKSEDMNCVEVFGKNNNQFIIKENLELKSDKPDIGNIIRYDINIMSLDKKVIDNKVIIKGVSKLNVLYTPFERERVEKNIPIKIEYEIPFNQIIDIPGLNPGDECEIEVGLVWSEILPKSDNNGQNRNISIDLTYNVVVKCYKKEVSNVVTDVYSTLKEINIENETVNCYQIMKNVDERFSIEANIAVEDAQEIEILDVWNQGKVLFIQKTEVGLMLEGKMELSILGLNSDKDPIYIEKVIDYQKEIEIKDEIEGKIKYDIRVETEDIKYEINYDSLDVKIEMRMTGKVYKNNEIKLIKEVEIDEDAASKERLEEDSLILYYAQPGEDIWEIGKRYNTNMTAIMEENEGIGEGKIREKMMLMIPIVN